MNRYTSHHAVTHYTADRRISLAWLTGILSILAVSLVISCSPEEQDIEGETVFTATDQQLLAVELPDKTKVMLNKGGKLTLKHDFGDTIREVELLGEAYFEVTHDPRRKFIVHCNTVTTTVLGTSFNIKFSPGNGDVAITVKQGKVNVSDETHDYGDLVSRQQVVVTPSVHKAYHAYVDITKIMSWWSESSMLIDRGLASAISSLELRYNSRIILENEALRDCIVNISPDYKEDLDGILRVLAISVNAELIQKNDTYIIRGGACN